MPILGPRILFPPPPLCFFPKFGPCAYRIMHGHEFMQVAKRNAVFTVQPLFLLANCIKNEVMLHCSAVSCKQVLITTHDYDIMYGHGD